MIVPVTIGPSKAGATTCARSRARRRSRGPVRAARSNRIVPEPSARSTACSPVSRSRTRSLGSSTCAIEAHLGLVASQPQQLGCREPRQGVVARDRDQAPTTDDLADRVALGPGPLVVPQDRRTQDLVSGIKRDQAVHLSREPYGLHRRGVRLRRLEAARTPPWRSTRGGSCSLQEGAASRTGTPTPPRRAPPPPSPAGPPWSPWWRRPARGRGSRRSLGRVMPCHVHDLASRRHRAPSRRSTVS